MKKIIGLIFFIHTSGIIGIGCAEHSPKKEVNNQADTSYINLNHLDQLYIPITFSNGVKAAGVYIYSEAPDYHHVADSDEGFTCVDDVARAAQVYLRISTFSSDTSIQVKALNLLRFILEMQADNGYFYNFLFPGDTINRDGQTSKNGPNWWSWRALATLTEAAPLVKTLDAQLTRKLDDAVKKIAGKIKADIVNTPPTTKVVNGIIVPQWLPAGSATDQAAILIVGLIPYCKMTGDPVLKNYIKKLADGIAMMQSGDAATFPYSCFLSWENMWHAYGNDQAYALFKAAGFFNDSTYSQKAIREVNDFYPWLLNSGFKASFNVIKKGNQLEPVDERRYAQIAYGVRPMVFSAAEAYLLTGEEKYADIAGDLAAWLMGKNDAASNIYEPLTGRCYDGIIGKDSINYNSGAESTIEALLTLQMVERIPAVKAAFNKYKKQ